MHLIRAEYVWYFLLVSHLPELGPPVFSMRPELGSFGVGSAVLAVSIIYADPHSHHDSIPLQPDVTIQCQACGHTTCLKLVNNTAATQNFFSQQV